MVVVQAIFAIIIMLVAYNRNIKKNVWDDIKKKVTDYREVSFFKVYIKPFLPIFRLMRVKW